ncbi:MAG: class I SAM-dependent DNA methyltransferase [Verrucomicrobiaceae bacterium]|nr:class I SAM-dependent DNA methyltransferase [Verrucomicrobiaceae bacterium]
MVSTLPATPEAFIDHWTRAEANERANSQAFLLGLAHLLGVPAPSNSHADGYSFEYPVKVPGGSSTNFIDLYRRGHFVFESKQFAARREELSALEAAAVQAGAIAAAAKKSGPVRDTGAWSDAMIRAKGQAERYVRSLPAEEPNPPFILVGDIGHSIEVYADFTQAGKAYLPFPDPRSFRIPLKDLAREDVRERLRLIWTQPAALDPAKVSADVTREIAGYLAELAKSFEAGGHEPEVTAQFLTRCLFCMFAEDVGLLPDRAFTELLASIPESGEGFAPMLGTLFQEMDTGTGFSVILRKKLLRFNGGLFKDHTVLPVNALQLALLKQAAKTNWRNVEPAIFGTLLERALNPADRHALGAHFTPRAYVERLVLPTVIEPLREEWDAVRAAAITHANRSSLRLENAAAFEEASSAKMKAGEIEAAKIDFKKATDEKRGAEADLKKAQQEILTYHDRLCRLRVLDPACGCGNFLYVSLQQLKILEGEVLDFAAQFGEDMKLELDTHTVDPHQFLGIELNPRAASIAELVLWIGYLQWHFKIHGQRTPSEPILRAFKNIENRDAVLAYDGDPVPAKDEAGNVITVWDRRSKKIDTVTNREVPDETKRVPLLTYTNPRPAEWPEADYIVGNPPFIGASKMREDLGDGYAETLRETYPEIPESADLVLYWWHKAAQYVRSSGFSPSEDSARPEGRTTSKRFGLITTNSLRQTFARRIVEAHLKPKETDLPSPPKEGLGKPLSLLFAIPDHPWVDTEDGAAVRIAMTVGAAGQHEGTLSEVIDEIPHEDGSAEVSLSTQRGKISADLSVGTDVTSAVTLRSNERLAYRGMQLIGAGFIVEPQVAASLGLGVPAEVEKVIRPYRNGRDLMDAPRGVLAIDLFGLTEQEARANYPTVFQHVLTHVKPERDANNRESYRRNWWIHGEPRKDLRPALSGLGRYIATVETAKHRIFQFLSPEVLPDNKLVVIALDDAFHIGVLSSRIHVAWALGQGAMLEDRPVYPKSECFDPFPFPVCGEAEKERIRALAEELDAHRKRVQAQHPGLTLTGMYNVLEKLRSFVVRPSGRALEAPDGLKPELPTQNGLKPELQTLTDKERLIHDQGLVSLLQQLHDDLDAAVFAAYGWPATLTDAEILERLVHLNAQRADEEKRGIIHWLRPDYQNAGQRAKSEESPELPLKPKKGTKAAKSEIRNPKSKIPWPKTLADRIRAVEAALHAAGAPVTAADLSKHFTSTKPAALQEILESLAALGRARVDGERFAV